MRRNFLIHRYHNVTSTNDIAKELVHTLNDVPLAVLADMQSDGRGQGHNAWQSLKGNLFLSLLLWQKDVPNLALLPLYAGLTIQQAIQPFLHTQCLLKWPNDILINGAKVGGILIEPLPPQKAVIIGIGVNIQHSPISNTRHPSEALQNFARTPLHCDKIVEAILDRWMQHPLVDTPTIVAQWQRAAYGIGEWIQAESQGKLIEGRFQGVNSQGALLLDNNITYATAKNLTFINNMTYTSPCT